MIICQYITILNLRENNCSHSPKQGLSTPTLDSLAVMQAKDSESNSTTFIDDHHVEVYVPVIVPSP